MTFLLQTLTATAEGINRGGNKPSQLVNEGRSGVQNGKKKKFWALKRGGDRTYYREVSNALKLV